MRVFCQAYVFYLAANVPVRARLVYLGQQDIYWPGNMPLYTIAAMESLEATDAWNSFNLSGAITLFGRSAQKGYGVGEYCHHVGQYHELAPADIAEARKWYKRGVRAQHRASITSLGTLLYKLGNQKEAFQIFQQAAQPSGIGDSGDSLAQWFLAELSLQAGAFRDAVRWWKRLAETGDIDAMMRLAGVFAQGITGVPQESERARHWFMSSAAHGHVGAVNSMVWNRSDADRPLVELRWIRTMQKMGWL